MNKDETRQNYLEAIHILSKTNPAVRAIDLCDYLGFSRPTVSIALKQLAKAGYLEYEGSDITLKAKGLKEAEMIYERHELIAGILMELGVEEKIAYADSCKIEHDLSFESFEAIKKTYSKHHKTLKGKQK